MAVSGLQRLANDPASGLGVGVAGLPIRLHSKRAKPELRNRAAIVERDPGNNIAIDLHKFLCLVTAGQGDTPVPAQRVESKSALPCTRLLAPGKTAMNP